LRHRSGWCFFARDLQTVVAGWPVGFWFAAQGSVVIFIAVVVLFAWRTNRLRDIPEPGNAPALSGYARRIHQRFGIYLFGLCACLLALGLAERAGLSKVWIAGIFLSLTAHLRVSLILPATPARQTQISPY
jgi:cation/acetate symporter